MNDNLLCAVTTLDPSHLNTMDGRHINKIIAYFSLASGVLSSFTSIDKSGSGLDSGGVLVGVLGRPEFVLFALDD